MKSIAYLSIITVAGLLSACAEDPTSETTATSTQAIVGQDTFLYFRSNATGWNVDSATRVRPTADPYVFSMLFDVKQDWMVSNGDNCQFSETNQLNGWGTKATNYGAVHGTVTVPGSDYLQSNGPGFTAKYPALGRYKVTANWMQGMFQIGAASKAEAWQPCLNEMVTTLAQAPQAPNNVLVGCSNGDLYLTFNGLTNNPSWLKVDTWSNSAGSFGLPDSPINAIAYNPKDTKTAYVAVAGSKQGHKLWKTGTGGANWVELSSVPLAEIWSISVNPADALKVYVAGPGGVAMSADAGTTWTTNVTAAPLTVPIAAGSKLSTVTAVNNDPNSIWVGATNGDIFYTTNATASNPTWNKATHGMPERMVLHVTVRPATDGYYAPTVYATFDGMFTDSLWVNSNFGFGWALLHNPNLPTTPMPLPGIYGLYNLSVNPIDNSVLYIDGTYGAGVSTSGGTSWYWASAN